MIERKTWEEFRKSALLWWVNRTLHLFGWALVYEIDKETREITEVYPARVSCRGFDREDEDQGFEVLTEYLIGEAPQLLKK